MTVSQAFYRSLNRDNIWNDPYHASARTWTSYHQRRKADSTTRSYSLSDTENQSVDDRRREFVCSSRIHTLERFHAQRQHNTDRARSPHYRPIPGLSHRRQDVCSGLTSPIGGDIRDLPPKALRTVMTPLIEHLDTDARSRLRNRLEEESREEQALEEARARRRKEFQQDVKDRNKYFEILEKLSGIQRIRIAPQQGSPSVVQCGERTIALAQPRGRKSMTPRECLDGLALVSISTPEVIESLHNKS